MKIHLFVILVLYQLLNYTKAKLSKYIEEDEELNFNNLQDPMAPIEKNITISDWNSKVYFTKEGYATWVRAKTSQKFYGCKLEFPNFAVNPTEKKVAEINPEIFHKMVVFNDVDYSILFQIAETQITLIKFSGTGEKMEKKIWKPDLADSAYFLERGSKLFTFFKDETLVNPFRCRVSFAVVNKKNQVIIVYCSRVSLICDFIKKIEIHDDDQVSKIVATKLGLYLSSKTNPSLSLIDYGWTYHSNQAYMYSRGLKSILNFDNKWIGITEESVYELSLKQDGYLEKKTLIFSCLGYIYDFSTTDNFFLIYYNDTPVKNKTIVFVTEKTIKGGWKAFYQRGMEGDILDVFQWNNYLVHYTLNDLVILKPPFKVVGNEIGVMYNYSYVSMFNKSLFEDKEQMYGAFAVGQNMKDLRLLSKTDEGISLSEVIIGDLSLNCHNADLKKIQDKSIKMRVKYHIGGNDKFKEVDYIINFLQNEKGLDKALLFILLVCIILFLVLFVFSIKNMRKVYKRRMLFRKTLKKYLIEVIKGNQDLEVLVDHGIIDRAFHRKSDFETYKNDWTRSNVMYNRTSL